MPMKANTHTKTLVAPQDAIRRAIELMSASAILIALVVDEAGVLLGTVTDGDIRRGMLRGVGLDERVELVMSANPVTAQSGASRSTILTLMSSSRVKQVPLLDQKGRVVGLELLDTLVTLPKVKENPVVVLAGGEGMRLRPLTENTPKPLLDIGGQPVLEVNLGQLQNHGFFRIFLSINYLGEHIERYFGNGQRHGMSIEYLRERKPMGTAGPLSLVPRPISLPCLVVNGDLLSKVDFESLLEYHRDGGFHLTIGVKNYQFQLPFGVVSVQGDQVVGIVEKPEEKRLINAGVYVLEPDILNIVPQDAYYDMNQLIESVLGLPGRKVGAFPIHEYWMDIGGVADYRQAQEDFDTHFTQS